MSLPSEMRAIVERLVDEVLEKHLPVVRSELVARLSKELSLSSAPEPAAAETGATGLLNAALASVHDSLSQTEILAALLEGAAKFAPRAALFVVRGGACQGWSARGLNDDEAIRSVSIDLNSGLAARAFQEGIPAAASAAEFDSQFLAKFGSPAHGTNVLLLPLVVRNKVVALLYADAGPAPAGVLDGSALECLVRGAGFWLELLAARKSGAGAVAEPSVPPAPEHAAPQPSPEAAPLVAEPSPPLPPSAEPALAAAAVSEPAPAPVTVVPVLQGDEEIHRKAKRFAKLLVDEIKLYNKSKVDEGRLHRDLYARLEDDIEKSRATYDKRYADTPAAKGDYFNQELIRNLANNDQSLLGSGFIR